MRNFASMQSDALSLFSKSTMLCLLKGNCTMKLKTIIAALACILLALPSCQDDAIVHPSGKYYTDFLSITNCYGNQENVHPKVLYFADGLFGHHYWIAYTPYPCGDPKYENPCVAYSDDGLRWQNVSKNPLDVPKDRKLKYNSDTHLVYNYDTGELELWFRYADEKNQKEIIYRKCSKNGKEWGEKEAVMVNDESGNCALFLSPTIIYENGEYHIWVVNLRKKAMEYYTSQQGNQWQYSHDIALNYALEGKRFFPWHMDIIHEEGKYILCMMVKGYNQQDDWCLFYSESVDNHQWTEPVIMLKPRHDHWDAKLYRSSLVKTPEGYSLYYSAKDEGHYGMGLLKASEPNGFLSLHDTTANSDGQ